MATSAGMPQTDALTSRLVSAFEGKIPRLWKSPLYLLGLLLVAGFILLLPVVYLGLIGLTAYGVYYHAENHSSLLYAGYIGHGRAAVMMLILRGVAYFGPMLAGAVLVVFMVKPLFARPARRERRISFVRENEPVLFSFVERLCEVVGAPPPRRIDVDCDLNASAGFRRGFLSLLGRDLVLRIGAPLVAGLTLQQFAGVLAHEFGHFSQGVGMRLTYVIDRVNEWFARVVYQRDTWDVQLIELSQAGPWYLSLVFLLARACVWITRKILWCLMVIAHTVSCGMLRQMEYDADRYEIQVSGSEAFECCMRRLHELALAWGAAHREMAVCWREHRLPDDLPAQIVVNAAKAPEIVRERIDRAIAESSTSLFATHPSDGARIRRARRENAAGIFHLKEPASILFRDFDALCREATFSYYQDLVGPEVRRDSLISTAAMGQRRKAMDDRVSAALRFFGAAAFVDRPIHINRFSKTFSLPAEECISQLKRARAAIGKSAPVIRRTYQRLCDAEQAVSRARQAESLLRAGVRIKAEEYGLKRADVSVAKSAYHQADQQRQAAEKDLARIEAVLALRLESALALLSFKHAVKRISQPDQLRARSHQLMDTLAALHNTTYLARDLRLDLNALQAMEAVLAEGHEDDQIISQTLKLLKTQNMNLTELRAALKETPYPYEHAEGSISVASYAVGIVPSENDLSGTVTCSVQTLEAVNSLHLRIAGELAQIDEQVEAALGLEPLRLPDENIAAQTAGRPTE